MSECVAQLCSHTAVSVAKDRTAELRKWSLRKKELDENFNGPEHCKKVLAGKPIRLFGEMMQAAGHNDVNLVSDIQNGFDLLGEIPPLLFSLRKPQWHRSALMTFASPPQRTNVRFGKPQRAVVTWMWRLKYTD